MICILIFFVLINCRTVDGFRSFEFGNLRKQDSKRKSYKLPIELSSIDNVGVLLLAGGKGKRMKSSVPKQFLPGAFNFVNFIFLLTVLGKPVFLRSLDVFQSMKNIVSNIVIVLDESYRDEYDYLVKDDVRISWADPGVERQDSVFNGLNKLPDSCKIVAIHDAARPLVTEDEVIRCLQDGLQHGAAVLGIIYINHRDNIYILN